MAGDALMLIDGNAVAAQTVWEYEESQALQLRAQWEDIMVQKQRSHRKVVVLLLHWTKVAPSYLDSEDEVDRLGRVFADLYQYTIFKRSLNPPEYSGKATKLILQKHLADAAVESDGPDTLLIVYYAGHGNPAPDGQLHLTGGNAMLEHPGSRTDSVTWNESEKLLRNTSADTLLIFDCCYAGKLVGGFRGLVPKRREFLGATGADGLTRVPGQYSFTNALIWALATLADTREGFTTVQLFSKIRAAPDFPSYCQTPVLSEHGEHSSQRICLRPLSRSNTAEPRQSSNTSRDDTEPDKGPFKYGLQLQFTFSALPTQEDISCLANTLKNALHNGDIKATSISWNNLRREEPKISFTAHLCALKWLSQTRRRRRKNSLGQSVQKKSQVSWEPLLGKRPRPDITLIEIEDQDNTRPPSKRARASSSKRSSPKRSSQRLSMPSSPPTTPSDNEDYLSEATVQTIGEETASSHSTRVQGLPSCGSQSSDRLANLNNSGTRSSLQQSNGSSTTTNLGAATLQIPLRLEAVRQWNETRLYCREELRSRTAYKNLAFARYHDDPSLVEAFRWLVRESEVRLPLHVGSTFRDFLDRSWTNDEHLLALQGFANLAISYASVKDAVSSGMTDERLTYLVVTSNRSNVAEFVSFEMIHLVNYVSRLGRLLRFPQLCGTEGDHWGFSYHAVVQGMEDPEWRLEPLSLSAFWDATEDFLAATKLNILWPQKTATRADSGEAGVQAVAMTMQTISNMIELIGIATLDGHTGSLWNAVTEAETLQIELPSASIPDNAIHEMRAFYSARHFDCLNDFTGGQPVWVLHSASVDNTDKLYLSILLDDFAKVWGPAWAVHDPSEPSEIHEIRVRLGVLAPQEHRLHLDPPLQDGEKLAHWTSDNLPCGTSCQELSSASSPVVSTRQPTATLRPEVTLTQSTGLALHFRHSDRLLIGARTHSPKLRRRSCHCSSTAGEIEDRLNRKGLVHRLGTSRPCRYRHSQQIGGTVGTHAGIGANNTYMIDPGQSLSQILLAGWENDPLSRHTSELENYCGLVISACTLNALRVRYVDLLNTPTMQRHLKLYQWKVETCKLEFYRALKSERPRALTALWETHPEWQDELGEIILLCMRVLSRTGYDARRNELEVLWISEGDPLPWAISLRTKDHNWIGSLQDEQCSMAAAVLIEESLYTRRSHSRICGDDSKHTVLETAYVINENAKGFRDLKIISSDEAAETHPWRSHDQAWEQVWSVKNVPTIFDGKLGRDFPTRCGSRLCALKRLTKTHLLARWSPQHFEFIRRPIFGPIAEPESECHWEQKKDLSDWTAHDRGTPCVRPLPLHVC